MTARERDFVKHTQSDSQDFLTRFMPVRPLWCIHTDPSALSSSYPLIPYPFHRKLDVEKQDFKKYLMGSWLAVRACNS